MMTSPVKNAARGARNLPGVRIAARAGFAVNGLLHAIIGAIAIGIAVGGGGEADQSGALGQIAGSPGGGILLWIVTVGLAALGLWLIAGAFLNQNSDPKKRVSRIVVECGKGIAYLALASAALTFALGGSSDSSSQTTSLSAQLLAAPGGVVLLVLLGLGVCAVGVYFVVKGIRKRFLEDITVPGGSRGKAIERLGVAGYAAKGIALFVVGVLFVVAAFTVDPERATGLDGALTALAGLPFGKVILTLVGLGLIAYGVYGFARAKLARL